MAARDWTTLPRLSMWVAALISGDSTLTAPQKALPLLRAPGSIVWPMRLGTSETVFKPAILPYLYAHVVSYKADFKRNRSTSSSPPTG